MAGLGVFVALLTLGILYQRVGAWRDRRVFPPPGRLIEVDGHRLHAHCRGDGSPVVLLESGIAASSLSWAVVQPAIAAFTRVCAYDRAGLAWSDAPSSGLTLHRIVEDLSAVIREVDAQGPLVLVGHSFGCFIVRTYAARHPDRVAGIVLVDPPTEWLTMTNEHVRRLRRAVFLSRIGGWLAHIGIVRACLALLMRGVPAAPRRFVKIFGPTAAQTLERFVGEVRKLPPDVHPVVQALWCQPRCFRAMSDYLLALEREGTSLTAETPPPDVPVVVISSADQPPDVVEAHWTLAASASSGRQLTAQRSGHWVPFDEPELIVDAVRDLVESRRRYTQLLPTPEVRPSGATMPR